MKISEIFLDHQNRLRSGWRFAVFIFAFTLAVYFVGAVIGVLMLLNLDQSVSPVFFFFIQGVVLLSLSLVIGWLCGKYLEGLPFRALGAAFTRSWLIHLVSGFTIGAATLGFAVLIAVIFGGLRFQFNPDSSRVLESLSISLLTFAAGAAWEEAFFRGYIFQTFVRSRLVWLAIALTATPFALIHAANPSAGIISTVNTALAGVWFGIAYLKTRDLWFVFGMHLMWNWTQGSLFGIEVSGLTELTSAPLLKEIDTGPAWLTGETYGVEGGIVTTIALIVSIAAIYVLPLHRSEPPALAGGQFFRIPNI